MAASPSKKYKLIANPAAGRGRSSATAARIKDAFEKRGASFDLEFTRSAREAEYIARKALVDFDVIVAIGGDGTLNEIIPAMLFSSKPLGIIPAGSGNDFIRSLGIPNQIERAIDIIFDGKITVSDAGRINDRYFVNGVGIGFDAAVNLTSHAINSSKRGTGLYLRALLKTLGKFRPVSVKIGVQGETLRHDIFLLTVGNGTAVGGGFKLTPHAVLDDGLFDVTMVKPLGTPRLLWHLPKVFLGTIGKVKEYVTMFRTDRLVVEAAGWVPVHLDGEIYEGEERRFEITVVPKALTLIHNMKSRQTRGGTHLLLQDP